MGGSVVDSWVMHQAVADPSGRFVATCDTFGRVLVLESHSLQVRPMTHKDSRLHHVCVICIALQVVRMFKGYRNAQVSWLWAVDNWEGQVHASVHVGRSRTTVDPHALLCVCSGLALQCHPLRRRTLGTASTSRSTLPSEVSSSCGAW